MDRVCPGPSAGPSSGCSRTAHLPRQPLVNWDCHLQTAVADDEIIYENVQATSGTSAIPSSIRLPAAELRRGGDHAAETMLGDTAVACHPAPKRSSRRDRGDAPEARARLAPRQGRARPGARAARGAPAHAPATLKKLVAMAEEGRRVMLPLMNGHPAHHGAWPRSRRERLREDHAAHDPTTTRSAAAQQKIGIVNISGRRHARGGRRGLRRHGAIRGARPVVADCSARLIEAVEDHWSRSALRPLQDADRAVHLAQWFIAWRHRRRVVCGVARRASFAPRARQAARTPPTRVRSPTGGSSPSIRPVRYRNTYLNWLGEKRDWCISRQLWWGHRIPSGGHFAGAALARPARRSVRSSARDVCARIAAATAKEPRSPPARRSQRSPQPVATAAGGSCSSACATRRRGKSCGARGGGFEQDPDVLDTCLLQPVAALDARWPDPATAEVEPAGRAGAPGDAPTASTTTTRLLLVTARDIITLWWPACTSWALQPRRSAVHGRFIHATSSTQGRADEQVKGNGIDPSTSSSATAPTRCATCCARCRPACRTSACRPGDLAVHGRSSIWRRSSTDAASHLHLPADGREFDVLARCRRAGREAHQRPVRRWAELLQQALERGALRAHEPGRGAV